MTSHERNIQTVRTIAEEVFSRGRVELIPELIDPDYEDHSAPSGLRDRDGFRAIVEFWRASTSEFRVRVVHVFAAGDWVGLVDETSGVHDRGPLFGVPANGQRFSFQAVHAFRLNDGRFREHWVQTSLAEVLRRWADARGAEAA
jgi:predicted ester cyclase